MQKTPICDLSPSTKDRVCRELLAIERQIDDLEESTPHDELPPIYDELIMRRNAARSLLKIA